NELRFDQGIGTLINQALLAAPRIDLLPPTGQSRLIGSRFSTRLLIQRVQFLEHIFDVADDGNIDTHPLRNGRGINIYMNDLARILGEMSWIANNPVVESR